MCRIQIQPAHRGASRSVSIGGSYRLSLERLERAIAYRTGSGRLDCTLHATQESEVQSKRTVQVQLCSVAGSGHSTFLLRVAFDHLSRRRGQGLTCGPAPAPRANRFLRIHRSPVTACPTTRTPFALRLPRTLGAIAHPRPKPTCLTPSARRAQLLSVQHSRARHDVLRFPSSLTHLVPPYSHPTPSRRPTGLLQRPRCDEERLRQPPRKDDGCHVARLTASRPEGPARGSCPPQQAQTLADAARRRTPTGWMSCRHPGDSHCS